VGALVRRDLHALILALVGGTLFKLAWTGQYDRYVKVAMRPYLFVAAGTLLLVAAASLWPAVMGYRSSPSEDPDHAHAQGNGGFEVAWLLVIPSVVLLLIAPPALGAYSAGRSGTALNTAMTSDYPPLPSGDPVRVSVLDYAARAVFDHGSLSDRRVVLSGFLVSNAQGGWYLTRMIITCCAADAQPIKVGLAGQLPIDLRSNQWIQVTGVYLDRHDVDPFNKQTIPYISATSATVIQPPAQRYES
jgi:uncharacterized repeat protein (TIGR03943 family)